MSFRFAMHRQLGVLAVALLGHALPVLADVGVDIRGQWRAALNWPASCEEDWAAAPTGNGNGVTPYGLPDKRRLISVSCGGNAPSYQLYYLESAEGVANGPLRFPVYEDPPSNARARLVRQWSTELRGQTRYDEKSGELQVLQLKHSGSNCGTWASYGFDLNGPILLELRTKLECDTQGAPSPQRWQRQLVPH